MNKLRGYWRNCARCIATLGLLWTTSCRQESAPLPYVPPRAASSAQAVENEPSSIEDPTADPAQLERIKALLYIPPSIKVNLSKEYRTAYREGSITIHLEDYERCIAQGKQADLALALLLGHELYHAYRAAEGGYRNPTSVPCDAAEELDADVFGVFYAWLYADLPVKAHSSETIAKLLQGSYHGDCYPHLERRKQAAQLATQKAIALAHLTDAANLAFAMPWHNDALQPALQALRYLHNVLPNTPELANNLAVAYLRLALNQEGHDAFPFAFPLEADFALRLKTEQPKSGAKDFSRQQRLWMQEAQSLLELALRLHPKYAAARINHTALGLIREELPVINPSKLPNENGQLLYAISLAQNSREEEAKQHFSNLSQRAKSQGVRQLATINLAKMSGLPYPDHLPDLADNAIDIAGLYDELIAYRPSNQEVLPGFHFQTSHNAGVIGQLAGNGLAIRFVFNYPGVLQTKQQAVLCQRDGIHYLAIPAPHSNKITQVALFHYRTL